MSTSPSRPATQGQRDTDSPVSNPSSPDTTIDNDASLDDDSCSKRLSTKKTQRDSFFHALERKATYPVAKRAIQSADDLNEAQLKKCFEILHAFRSATYLNETLATTRQGIEGFLDTIFDDWSSEKPGSLIRSELEFQVDAAVVAGKICGVSSHKRIVDCISSPSCTASVTAVAKYSNNPPLFKLEFTVQHPFTMQPEALCPITKRNVRWMTTNWVQDLRKALRNKILGEMQTFNQQLAVWHARGLILEWARGSLSMGEDVSVMGFLDRGLANIAIAGLGKEV